MPPAVLVPIALAGASMIASNVQQKAANKNNLNQQAGAVSNAKNAEAQAQQKMQAMIAANPSPLAGQKVAAPTGGYAGPSGSPGMASHVLGQPPGAAVPTMSAGTRAMPVTGTAMPQATTQASPNAQGQFANSLAKMILNGSSMS